MKLGRLRALLAPLGFSTLGVVFGLAVMAAIPGAKTTHFAPSRAPAPSDSDFTDLARFVFKPTVEPYLNVPPSDVNLLLDRMRPKGNTDVGTLIHSLHLFGPDFCAPLDDQQVSHLPAIDVLLDVRLGKKYFAGNASLAATRYGARAPLFEEDLMGTDQRSVQAHHGQLLSVLAEMGVPPTRPIYLDGRVASVQDIVNDVIANFSLDRQAEIPWNAVSVAMYVPQKSWTDKWGAEHTFDDLATELMARTPENASCGGAHELIALTVLLRVNQRRDILSAGAQQAVIAHLTENVAALCSNQRVDGSWNLDWRERGDSPDRLAPSPLHSSDALLVTGHFVEWLTMLPEELLPERDVITRAAQWLVRALPIQTGDPEVVFDSKYCPLTHAVRSVRLLARTQAR